VRAQAAIVTADLAELFGTNTAVASLPRVVPK
jgi:hypothetical protein